MTDKSFSVFVLLIMAYIIILFLVIIKQDNDIKKFHETAINLNYAEYSSTTSKFQWITNRGK